MAFRLLDVARRAQIRVLRKVFEKAGSEQVVFIRERHAQAVFRKQDISICERVFSFERFFPRPVKYSLCERGFATTIQSIGAKQRVRNYILANRFDMEEALNGCSVTGACVERKVRIFKCPEQSQARGNGFDLFQLSYKFLDRYIIA